MAIVYHLDADGGFTCGDTETRLTSYAYPTSVHATDAARNSAMAQRTAELMISKEGPNRTAEFIREYDDRHWRILEANWRVVDTSV